MSQPPPPAPRTDPYPVSPSSGSGSDLGKVGFIFALIAVVVAAIQQSTSVFVPRIMADLPMMSMALWFGLFGIVHGLLSAAALILGLLGARRRRSLILSGIAIGVGGAGVIAAVIGLTIVPLIGYLL